MRNTARKIGVNSPLNTIFIMNISPIRTPEDHQRALARVSALMKLDPEPGTPKSDELEVLAQMVELYEKKRFDLGEPEPLDLIAFAMEQQGLTKKDMVPYLGSPSRVSEVLSGKRSLTLLMIYKLHTGLGLPLHPLVLGVVCPKLNLDSGMADRRFASVIDSTRLFASRPVSSKTQPLRVEEAL